MAKESEPERCTGRKTLLALKVEESHGLRNVGDLLKLENARLRFSLRASGREPSPADFTPVRPISDF